MEDSNENILNKLESGAFVLLDKKKDIYLVASNEDGYIELYMGGEDLGLWDFNEHGLNCALKESLLHI